MGEQPDISSEMQDSLRRHRQGGDTGGTLVVDAQTAYVGDEITLKGRNFDPGEEFDIVWHTTDGTWGVL